MPLRSTCVAPRPSIVSKDQPANLGATYLRVDAAARYLGISVSTLNKLRCRGGGPRYFRPGGTRICLYRAADLDHWVERSVGQCAGEVTP